MAVASTSRPHDRVEWAYARRPRQVHHDPPAVPAASSRRRRGRRSAATLRIVQLPSGCRARSLHPSGDRLSVPRRRHAASGCGVGAAPHQRGGCPDSPGPLARVAPVRGAGDAAPVDVMPLRPRCPDCSGGVCLRPLPRGPVLACCGAAVRHEGGRRHRGSLDARKRPGRRDDESVGRLEDPPLESDGAPGRHCAHRAAGARRLQIDSSHSPCPFVRA